MYPSISITDSPPTADDFYSRQQQTLEEAHYSFRTTARERHNDQHAEQGEEESFVVADLDRKAEGLNLKVLHHIIRVTEGRLTLGKPVGLCSSLFGEKNVLEPFTDPEFEKLMNAQNKLAEALRRGKELKTRLVLSFFELKPTDLKLIAEFLWRVPEIVNVEMDHVHGLNHYKACLPLVHALRNHKKIQTVDFSHSDCNTECAAALALACRTSGSIKRVILSHCKIKDIGVIFFSTCLKGGCITLEHLNLNKVGMTDKGIIALANAVKDHPCLSELYIDNNKIGRVGAKFLGECFKQNMTIQTISMSGNSMGSRGAAALAEALRDSHIRINHLELASNDIGPKGGAALAVAIAANSSLKYLDLSHNDLGDRGIAGFGPALSTNTSIEYLNISNNDITDTGAVALASGLGTNRSLLRLVLNRQNIGDVGVTEIANALASNECSLQELHLDQNQIRNKGAIALADMLRTNRTLKMLSVTSNEIGDSGGEALGKALLPSDDGNNGGGNELLEILDVSDNPISGSISRKFFTQAETARVKAGKEKLDILAKGTAIAKNNVGNFGVVFVVQSVGQDWRNTAMILLTWFISWFDFGSDLFVVISQYKASEITYFALTTTILSGSIFYVTFFLSIPIDESDQTLPVGDVEEEYEARKVARGGGGGGSTENSHFLGASGSFLEHLNAARKARWTPERFKLALISLCQLRLPYEFYLARQVGHTSIALGSVRLAEAVFEAVPQAIVQTHILFSERTMSTLDTTRPVKDAAPEAARNPEVLGLIISIAVSIIVMSYTITDLFEKRFIINWKRNAFHNEEFAMAVGMITGFFYHLLHFSSRAITIALVATYFGYVLAPAIYVCMVLVRATIFSHGSTERQPSFAFVSVFVGGASWDTRVGARLAHLYDGIETIAIAAVLHTPESIIAQAHSSYPLFVTGSMLRMRQVIGPFSMTGFLIGAYAAALFLYIIFIEKIHAYRDVKVNVDRAMEFANRPHLAELDRMKKADVRLMQKQQQQQQKQKSGGGNGNNLAAPVVWVRSGQAPNRAPQPGSWSYGVAGWS
jgi:Ran GTPase-activating protein (RanGAP) involved in mRNA processing and transport